MNIPAPSSKNPNPNLHFSINNEESTVTEEYLLRKNVITPEDVLNLPGFTKSFLCPPEANIHDIRFIAVRVTDFSNGKILFEVRKTPRRESLRPKNRSGDCKSAVGRYVRYQLAPSMLQLQSIGARVEFMIGMKSIQNLRMIERHYFKNHHLQNFDFEFGMCMPNTSNLCECIYTMPSLPHAMIKDMINNPYEVKSDSFYFADGKLIMHNKAAYSYNNKNPPKAK